MMAKQAPIRAAKVAPMQSFSLGKRRKKRDGWLMSFTWLVLFVVIGLSGAWWWQDHKAQQEEISTMADQSWFRLPPLRCRPLNSFLPVASLTSSQQSAEKFITRSAPYKLKIGAPAAVQIQYLGKPVDLSRFIRTNQVARLTLNAESSPAQ